MDAYMNTTTWNKVREILIDLNIRFSVVKPRKTCLGNWSFRNGQHYIKINNNLSREQFLVTTIHEIAHAKTWNAYKGKVKPHGEEWKRYFRNTMLPLLDGSHDTVMEECIRKHMENPTASSYSDANFVKTLHSDQLFLESIPIGTKFSFKGDSRIFIKDIKKRVNYTIYDLEGKKYTAKNTSHVVLV